MNKNELAALLPLPDQITASLAASILGGAHWLRTIMDLVVRGDWLSLSHSAPSRYATMRTNCDAGDVKVLPCASLKTDPDDVLVPSDEVLWRWCVEMEMSFQGGDKLPPKALVEARLAELKRYSQRLKSPAL